MCETQPCDVAKSAGVALVRWALGLLFLVGGISKLAMLQGFVTGYLLPAFSKTVLPVGLITAYGYTLPFVETLLGVALLGGWCRIPTLVLAGLTLLSLAFGQLLIQGHATFATIMVDLLMTAVALFGQAHDTWVLGPCCCRKGRGAAASRQAPAGGGGTPAA